MGDVTQAWTIPGADHQAILGDTHMPRESPRATIVIAHGFKGYKDYGMFPRLAQSFAKAGLVAHRFNFSHSGMTNDISTFARPDLFERDTWRKQVFDLHAIVEAIAVGRLAGSKLPIVVLGHSRGGVTAMLSAGDLTYLDKRQNNASQAWSGMITLAAPATCNPLSADQQHMLLAQGWIESPSSRTGQRLRVGRAFLQEQLDDPDGHDVFAHAARVDCPWLIMHGAIDATVSPDDAQKLFHAAGHDAFLTMIEDGDHVFNTPNPLPEDQPVSPQLQRVIDESLDFILRCPARQ